MNLKRNNNLRIYIISLAVAFAYALFILFGPLGYGIDVHESYIHSENWISENWISSPEQIGWYIASLNVNIFELDYFIGASITSFILAFGLFLFLFASLSSQFNIFSVTIIGLLLLFSHPIIFSSTNVLRQGAATGFFYIFLYFFIKGYKFRAITISIFSIFSHNAIALIYINFYIYYLPIPSFFKTFAHIIFTLIIFIYAENFISLKSSIDTSLDYILVIFCILIMYIFLLKVFFNKYKKKFTYEIDKNFINLFLYNLILLVALIESPSAVQRLLMIILIPIFVIMINVLPIRKNYKLFTYIFLSMMWALLTLNSSALETWNQL
jgi:hypothetical protein